MKTNSLFVKSNFLRVLARKLRGLSIFRQFGFVKFSRHITSKKLSNGSLKKKFFLFVFFSLLLFVVLLLLIFLAKILSIKPSSLEETSYDYEISSTGSFNLLLSVYKKKDFNQAHLLSTNVLIFDFANSSTKLIGLNSNYIIESDKPLFKYLDFNNKESVNELLKGISNFLGIRVEKYLVWEEESFKNFISNFGFFLNSEVDFISGENKIAKGSELTGDLLSTYILDDQKGNQSLRMIEFISKSLRSNTGIVTQMKLFWELDMILDGFYTSMNTQDILRVYNQLISTKESIRSIYIDGKQAQEAKIGALYLLQPNYILLDDYIKNNLFNFQVLKEQARIEVFNATGKRGLAAKFSRYYQNSGGYVIKSGNFTDIIEETLIYFPNKEVSSQDLPNTYNLIKKILLGKGNISYDFDGNFTGEIIVVLGKDVENFF